MAVILSHITLTVGQAPGISTAGNSSLLEANAGVKRCVLPHVQPGGQGEMPPDTSSVLCVSAFVLHKYVMCEG